MNTRSRLRDLLPSVWMLVWVCFCLVAFSGCLSFSGHDDQALIQRVLDLTLPPTFTGDAHVEHKNSYLDFVIDARGLSRESGSWHWQSMSYRRNGRFSHGVISLGGPQK